MTPRQCKAARALLGWTQYHLARRAGVAVSTVADYEREVRELMPNNAKAVRCALESAGIQFVNGGLVLEADIIL